ncbi:MAG: hypothetical protein FJ117_08010 [Deltaproteobacteria bacterium]|nr:hypothetical protein [Deltaproteobacteria bacterium]
MDTMRKILKGLVDEIPDQKIGKAIEVLEHLSEEGNNDAWAIWAEFGKDAIEGRWRDASEKHDFYLYGLDR